MKEQVLVFQRALFPTLPRTGFIPDVDILPKILSQTTFMPREKVEHDTRYKQLVTYSILRYKDCILRYKRSAWGSESRLHQLYSIGVGGHVNQTDTQLSLFDVHSLLELTRDRELAEEFHVEKPGKPRLIGIINDESNEVGLVHLGIVYEYWMKSPNVTPREKRVHIQHELASIHDLVENEHQYENWSRSLITHYLANNHAIVAT